MIKVGSIVAVLGVHIIVRERLYDNDGWLRVITGELIEEAPGYSHWQNFDPTEVAVTVMTVH